MAALPLDILFDHHEHSLMKDVTTPAEYSEDVNFALKDIYNFVIENLQISKRKMQQMYNENLRFNDYQPREKVWLKVKHYKTGESRKLSPRRNGPWNVIEKLPNGVNFRITNEQTNQQKVVHHDRLTPVRDNVMHRQLPERVLPRFGNRGRMASNNQKDPNIDSSSDYSDSSDSSDFEPESQSDKELAEPTADRYILVAFKFNGNFLAEFRGPLYRSDSLVY